MFRIKGKVQFRKYNTETTASPGRAPVMDYMLNLQHKADEPNSTETKKDPAAAGKSLLEVYDSIKASLGKRPYDFQSEFDYGIKLFDWDSVSASKITTAQNGYVFRFSRVRPYFVRFSVDKVIASVDNNIIMTRYQPFDPNVPQLPYQP